MEIDKNRYPLRSKHPVIHDQFANWWVFLNSAGIFSFLLFLACLGAGENKYFCALLSLSLMAWLMFIGRNKYPEFSTKLRTRNSKTLNDKEFNKEIWKEQLPVFKVPLIHWPYWLGYLSLTSLAASPLYPVVNLSLYIPTYIRVSV